MSTSARATGDAHAVNAHAADAHAADARRAVRVLAADVAADGTDAELLALLVAWACGPRRDLDALRRRVRDDPSRTLATHALDGGAPQGPLLDVARRVLERWRALGVRVSLVGDPAYPARLAEGWPDSDAPVLLAWRGTPPADVGPSVAIVGARRATEYGTTVAGMLAAAVACAGGRVVSGGAVGIDAAAHEAALDLPGGTTVVLGCGHAVPYPKPHARTGALFDRVLEDGGTLVSELLPEVVPHPGVIRARNRILAGLADVVVVVEGDERSGALLTASAAAERGRDVLAVPGDVLRPGSRAPHRLLAEGAAPCTGPADVLARMPRHRSPDAPGGGGPHDARGAPAAPSSHPEEAAAAGLLPGSVVQALVTAWPRGVPLDALAQVTDVGTGTLLAALTRARIAGVVEDVVGGVRLRERRPALVRPSGR
jgi:DNA processing protein